MRKVANYMAALSSAVNLASERRRRRGPGEVTNSFAFLERRGDLGRGTNS